MTHTPVEDPEAARIVAELLKMHRAGVLPKNDRYFVASVIKTFGATFTHREPEKVTTGPYVPTKAQRVRVPFGLTDKERKQFLQDDLNAAIGE